MGYVGYGIASFAGYTKISFYGLMGSGIASKAGHTRAHKTH